MAKREGKAFIEVHADTSEFAEEARRGVKRGSEQAEDSLEEAGDEWGKTLTEAMGDRLEKSGPNLGKSIKKGLDKEPIVAKVTPEVDRNSVRRAIPRIVRDIEDAVEEAAGGGGGAGGFRLGQAFADAIGAGFNVSGRSPLIAFIVPLVGAIIGVVAAAIQALNALAAVALTIPGILAAIGIQVGVLMIAFEGVGTAIQGAFAAKNAKELKEALKDLQPAAQAFVKELLPLKDFFFQLKGQVQQGFFKELEGVFTGIYRSLGPRIFDGFIKVASSLGRFLADLGNFLASSENLKKFLDEIFPRTILFLENFGPRFITFLDGLLALINASMPMLTKVGDILGMVFKQLGEAMTKAAEDPDFQKWLEDMGDTLVTIVQFLRAAGIFLGALFTAVDKAGGEDMIAKFSEALIMLALFLTSDAGIQGMTALIDIAILSVQAITAFVIVILFLFGAVRAFFVWLGSTAGPAILEFFGAAANAVANFFVMIGTKIKEFWDFLWWVFVGGGVNEVMTSIRARFGAVGEFFSGWVTRIKNFFTSIPDRIKEAFSNAKTFLFNAGRHIMEGLIDGILSKVSSLGEVMSNYVGRTIKRFLPSSPAEEGPLSGKGDPLYSGQTIVKRLATGMEMAAPELRSASSDATQNIVFGPNSIQMRINGTMDRDQGRAAGAGVAEGIWTNLNRDTRLAIRTM